MSKTLKDSLVVGFALFAVFFGAGNLIFPGAIGAAAGTSWPVALIALFIASIFLPILAIIAISNAEGTFESLTKPIGKWFYVAFNLFVMIGVGALVNIPRTAATTHELSISPLFPSIPIQTTIVVFFAITYYFANDKSNFIDKIGKILTPALILILVVIVFKGIISPVGVIKETGISNPFSSTFIELYYTGDLLTGLLCAPIFISAIVAKGYKETAERKKITLYASIIAGIGFAIVYGGLLYVGATANSLFPQDVGRTALLNGLVKNLLGSVGMVGLSIAVLLACLSTAIGLSAAISDFISSITNNKITYRMCVGIICITGVFVGAMGVEKIISLAGPIFILVYPSAIVLTILGVFKKYVPNKGAFKYSVLFTLVISMLESSGYLGLGIASKIVGMMPFSSQGYAWIVPAMLGFLIGYMVYKYKTGKQILWEQEILDKK